jgi:hypothetical protein
MSDTKPNIPGLKSIEEELLPDGKMRLIFNIEDDQSEDFFKFLGIEAGNTEEFEKLIHEVLSTYLVKREEKSNEP